MEPEVIWDGGEWHRIDPRPQSTFAAEPYKLEAVLLNEGSIPILEVGIRVKDGQYRIVVDPRVLQMLRDLNLRKFLIPAIGDALARIGHEGMAK